MASSQLVRRIIKTASAGPVLGPYNQGVQIGRTIYLSGTTGLDPETGEFVGEGIEEQARQALKNIGEMLKTVGATYRNIVKVNVFLRDMNDFSIMNVVYSEFFSERQPARTTVQVDGLPKNARFEIEAVAVLGDIQEE